MIFIALLIYGLLMSVASWADISDAHSIYVPRQMSYNPILENALSYNKKNIFLYESSVCEGCLDTEIDVQQARERSMIDGDIDLYGVPAHSWDYLFSVKPIYTQTIGTSLREYFTINNFKCPLRVRENGLGLIDSLWLQVSAYPNSYQSTMVLSPESKTGGGLLFFQVQLPCDLSLSIDTALIHMSNSVHMMEKDVLYTGTSKFRTVADAFASSENCYGRICGTHGKTGLDDIQVKLIRNMHDTACYHWDVYGLLGIPTGSGSQAEYLFEPLVGSKHVQLGFGTSALWQAYEAHWGVLSLQGEAKYRYGFKATEKRSFDLKCNGQWSRYMLFVDQSAPYTVFPAIDSLTFKTAVTPRSSLDIYLAAHYAYKSWHLELGYDFWYRSAEHVSIKGCTLPSTVGIADLLGIANHAPHTASTANISQGIVYALNQMVSDSSFVPVSLSDINMTSGAAPRSLSNSVYASLGYAIDSYAHPMEFGINASYEGGTNAYRANSVSGWVSFDIYI